MVVGWLLGYYRPVPHLTHAPAHLHAFTTILRLAGTVIAFVCIFYYARGRNWARIAVLLTSILSILSVVFQLRREDVSGRIASAAWSLLGVFFLYWLNTRSVREFFKQPANTVER